jgi:hypothetical protein
MMLFAQPVSTRAASVLSTRAASVLARSAKFKQKKSIFFALHDVMYYTTNISSRPTTA